MYKIQGYVRVHFVNPGYSTWAKTRAYDRLYAYFNQDYGPGAYRGIYLQGTSTRAPCSRGGWSRFATWG